MRCAHHQAVVHFAALRLYRLQHGDQCDVRSVEDLHQILSMKGDLLRFEQAKLVLLPEQGAPVELRLAQVEDRIVALLPQLGRVEVGVVVEVDFLQACQKSSKVSGLFEESLRTREFSKMKFKMSNRFAIWQCSSWSNTYRECPDC